MTTRRGRVFGLALFCALALAVPSSMAQTPPADETADSAPGTAIEDAVAETSNPSDAAHTFGGLLDETPAADAPEPIITDIDAVRDAHREFLKSSDLQFERPEELQPEFTDPDPPNWLIALGEWLSQLAPIFQFAFYAACALVVAGLAYFIIGELIRVRFGKSGKGSVDTNADDALVDVRPDADEARSLLEEADALAVQGRYAEAVHLLLFRSINDIQKRLDGGVPRSLTAREIGSLSRLPQAARRALGPIIAIVERSHFGGRDVDQAGWLEARQAYEHFAFGETWK